MTVRKDSQKFEAVSAAYISNKLFDKMSEFSEEYATKVIESIKHIWANGPDKEALRFGHELADIRFKFCAWLPVETSKKLENGFEAILRKIGAGEITLESIGVGEHRTKIVYENHDFVLKMIDNSGQQDDSIYYWDVIDFLQETLGIKKVFNLKSQVLSKFD